MDISTGAPNAVLSKSSTMGDASLSFFLSVWTLDVLLGRVALRQFLMRCNQVPIRVLHDTAVRHGRHRIGIGLFFRPLICQRVSSVRNATMKCERWIPSG